MAKTVPNTTPTTSTELTLEPTTEEPEPIEYSLADADKLSQYVSKEMLKKSFYLHFVFIFLLPIISLIVAMPSPHTHHWPHNHCLESVVVTAINSVHLFYSYDDIYPLADYHRKQLLWISDSAELSDGYSLFAIVALLLDVFFIFRITPASMTSFEALLSGQWDAGLDADLIYLYLFEVIRIFLLPILMTYQREIRLQTGHRNRYLMRKAMEYRLSLDDTVRQSPENRSST